jgi:hypothetical protein
MSDLTVTLPRAGGVLLRREDGGRWGQQVEPWSGSLIFAEVLEVTVEDLPFAFVSFYAPELGVHLPMRSDIFAKLAPALERGELVGEWQAYELVPAEGDGGSVFTIGPTGWDFE